MGDKATNFIREICTNSEKALFIDSSEKDIGIDAHLDILFENGEPTGAFALIQSKGGLSRITKSKRSKSEQYKIQADKKHFETWSRYKNPVIGIVYNPNRHDARWVSISEHLQSHPNCIETGPYVIYAPQDQPFSLEGFTKFQHYVMEYHNRLSNDPAQILIDQYFSGDIVKKYESLVQLFNSYRWTSLSCFFFHQVLRIEEEPTILRELSFIIGAYQYYTYHLTDTKYNQDTFLISLAQKCIAGYGKIEVLKMMTAFDEEEDGLEEGSIGQLVALQLKYIPNIKGILSEIARDRLVEPVKRGYAILILAAILDYSDRLFYQSLLQHEQSLLPNKINSFVIETLYWALEWVIEDDEDEHESIPNLVTHNIRPGEIIQFLLF